MLGVIGISWGHSKACVLLSAWGHGSFGMNGADHADYQDYNTHHDHGYGIGIERFGIFIQTSIIAIWVLVIMPMLMVDRRKLDPPVEKIWHTGIMIIWIIMHRKTFVHRHL